MNWTISGSWKKIAGLAAAAMALSQAAGAQLPPNGPSPSETGTIYLANGQVLAAQEPRTLTKNATISQFICAPTGTRIGYLTHRYNRDAMGFVSAIGIATTQSGDNTTYFTANEPLFGDGGAKDIIENLHLQGWSDDAAYFAFSDRDGPTHADPGQPTTLGEMRCVDLVRGSVQSVPLPLDQLAPAAQAGFGGAKEPLVEEVVLNGVWAPQAHLLAFTLRAAYPGDRYAWGLFLYDADRQTTRLLTTYSRKSGESADPVLEGWVDSKRLVYHAPGARFIYDLQSDKQGPVPPNTIVARAPVLDYRPGKDSTTAAVGNVTLTLKEGRSSFTDKAGATTLLDSVSITRTGGSLKAGTLLLDAFPGIGSTGDAQFLPNNGFDRAGVYHVVYVPFGRDLKVIDLIQRPATLQEKVASGDTLTCDEEIQMAQGDERLIGTGLVGYAKKSGAWPAGDLPGVMAKVLNPDFSFGRFFTTPNGVPFRYTPPAKPPDQLTDPSNTPIGEFDLPCASVVLYADGQSKVVNKEQSAP